MTEDAFLEKLIDVFGPRCGDFNENCVRCQAWLLYDVIDGQPRPDALFVRSSLVEKLICVAAEASSDPDDAIGEASELLAIRRTA